MQEIYLDQYHTFLQSIRQITFQNVQDKFIEHQNCNPINKFVGEYVPKLQQYEQEFDQHKRQAQTMKKIPAFDGKKEFNNKDNLHRKIISIFKSFLLSEIKDLRQYLRLTIDIDQVSQLLSRIEILRFKSNEFGLMYFLFTATKRSIRIFLKLREEIIKESTFSVTQYSPISTHNPAKYTAKYHYLDKIMLSRKKKQWQDLIHMAGFEYDDQFTQLVFDSRDEVEAVEFIEYCLWLNKATAHSVTSSPTK